VAQPARRETILVVSPHFDDAILSCGQLLAAHSGSATVLTVFGGKPDRYPSPPTDWDAWGGFTEGDDIVAIRRIEDLNALEVLGVAQRYLDLVDWQYVPDDRPTPSDIAPVLEVAVAEVAPDRIFLPLGIRQGDHILTSEACLAVVRHRAVRWNIYEEAMYRKQCPEIVAERIERMRALGTPTPAHPPVASTVDLKRESLAQYVSQMKVLGGFVDDDAYAPERYWRIG
jgi:LmbE family N-acetylglucosaminyl deacetylase